MSKIACNILQQFFQWPPPSETPGPPLATNVEMLERLLSWTIEESLPTGLNCLTSSSPFTSWQHTYSAYVVLRTVRYGLRTFAYRSRAMNCWDEVVLAAGAGERVADEHGTWHQADAGRVIRQPARQHHWRSSLLSLPCRRARPTLRQHRQPRLRTHHRRTTVSRRGPPLLCCVRKGPFTLLTLSHRIWSKLQSRPLLKTKSLRSGPCSVQFNSDEIRLDEMRRVTRTVLNVLAVKLNVEIKPNSGKTDATLCVQL